MPLLYSNTEAYQEAIENKLNFFLSHYTQKMPVYYTLQDFSPFNALYVCLNYNLSPDKVLSLFKPTLLQWDRVEKIQ